MKSVPREAQQGLGHFRFPAPVQEEESKVMKPFLLWQRSHQPTVGVAHPAGGRRSEACRQPTKEVLSYRSQSCAAKDAVCLHLLPPANDALWQERVCWHISTTPCLSTRGDSVATFRIMERSIRQGPVPSKGMGLRNG
jgi:hypothetical protein